MPNECDPKTCPWFSGRCPIALDEKIKGVEKVIEERRTLNEARYFQSQNEVKLAKLEADKDISIITATLKQVSDTLTVISNALSSRAGSKRWTDQLITAIIAIIAAALVSFVFQHR